MVENEVWQKDTHSKYLPYTYYILGDAKRLSNWRLVEKKNTFRLGYICDYN